MTPKPLLVLLECLQELNEIGHSQHVLPVVVALDGFRQEVVLPPEAAHFPVCGLP